MKKYIDFLLEDSSVQDDTKDDTIKEASTVDFETLNNKLKELWNKVFTTRMLNFSQDQIPKLELKLKNPKYAKYDQEMRKILQQKNDSNVKRKQAEDLELNKFNTASKIQAAINTLVKLGTVKLQNAKDIVNSINKADPNMTETELITKAVQSLGTGKVKQGNQILVPDNHKNN